MESNAYEVLSVDIDVRGAPRKARLTLPTSQNESLPAIVFVHGSGHGDEYAFGREAERFAEHGIAFLSVAKVTHDYSGLRRNYDRLAADAAEAAVWLGAQSGIDTARIGLLGISEGCWVATSCAARHADIIDFVILESAAIITPANQMMYSIKEEVSARSLPVRTLQIAKMKAITLLCTYRNFNSVPLLKRIPQPVFAVWGGADRVVPVDQAMSMLKTHASSPLSTRVVEGEGHHLNPELSWLDDIATWTRGLSV